MAMVENVISLAEWKTQLRRKMWVWYPAEIIGYENGMPVWRLELIDAATALEPKIDPLDAC